MPGAALTAALAGVLAAALPATLLAGGPGPLGGPPAAAGGRGGAPATRPTAVVVSYGPPVPGAVVRPFTPPPTPYAAGHRGVDLAAAPGDPVGAAAAGTVRFAGPVAGRGVVVLAHPDGVTTEYEPVRPGVRTGQAVRRGQPVGRVAGRHPGCPGWCLHWGARRAGAYFDPLSLLRALGPVVLLPWPRGPDEPP